MLNLYIESSTSTWIEQIVDNIPHIKTSIDECDYIVSTKIGWGCADPTTIQSTIDSYKDYNKKVIIFLVSDFNEPFDMPQNILLFRTGLYRSQKKPNEYLLPFLWAKSEMNNEGAFEPLPKIGLQPKVGFCGSCISHPSRLAYINVLKTTPNIIKNLVLKTEYWGGNPHNPRVINEFLNNIKNTHFTLSTRGTGNWSARFYQVLSLCRIPVIVDTDIVLPFEDKINWNDIVVYCKSKDDIGVNIKQFWVQKDIIQAQQRCKEIYDTYLSPEKWCKIIAEEILEHLKDD